ncbi:sulfatase [Rubrivirga sp.]|uniref:sulfatase n=1 Tax=Rubrivirga sp. TaxID=1885344 RepID=UPI003B52FE22
MRLAFLVLIAVLAGCSGTSPEDPGPITPEPTEPGPAPSGPPNVILIVADDLGWHDLGVYGNRFHLTPRLDRMAAEGMRFTDGYAASPICSPSRAALMTGQSPAALHITEHFRGTPPVEDWQRLIPPDQESNLPLSTTTIAEAAKRVGYTTAHIGKWHLGYEGSLPEDHGFDVNVAGSGRGLPPSFFYPYVDGGSTDLFGRPIDPDRQGEYLTDRLTNEAIDYIEAHRDTAFVLHLAYYAPHVPIEGEPEKVRAYQARAAAGDYGFENPEYAAMVETIDDNVGRVLDALDRLGLAQNTLVVFLSDNGGLSVEEVPAFAAHTPATDNGPLRAGKGYLFEGGTRVPFIAWWPGVVQAATSGEPVSNLDLFSTVADWIGSPVPAAVEGVSLRGLLTTGAAPMRASPLTWYFPHYSPQGTRPARSIRDGRLKLIEKLEFGDTFLFDVVADPGETTNLADDRPDDVARLRQILDETLARQDAPPPRRNPSYSSVAPVPARWVTPDS